MTPLERAARALALKRGTQLFARGASSKSPEQYSQERWLDFEEDARTVLQAIREPNAAMLAAGRNPPDDSIRAILPEIGIWRAMIDAALQEG